jgi:proteasome lid subunit RPN8/RPN11
VPHLELPASARLALLAQLRAAAGEECCGALFGRAATSAGGAAPARVERVAPAANLAADRGRAFVLAPRDLARALAAARRDGLDLLGFYHSHPHGEGSPSAADRRGGWPGTRCVVLAARGGELEVRSFVLGAGGAAAPEPVVG